MRAFRFGEGLAVVLLAVLLSATAIALTTLPVTMTWVVPSNKSFSVGYGGNCNGAVFYFVETDANMDNDIDGNGSKIPPSSAIEGGHDYICQSASVAPLTITNGGNVALNIDGNFDDPWAGDDVNLALKVWLGSDNGCGTGGFGGWEFPCSVIVSTDPVTQTTCRDFNSLHEQDPGRLITNLFVLDTNQLCFSGDMNSPEVGVPQGSHALPFRLSVPA